MKRKNTMLVIYAILFAAGLFLVISSESIAEGQARVISDVNPQVWSVNAEDVDRKMIPIIVFGGIIALVAGNGIVLTLSKKV